MPSALGHDRCLSLPMFHVFTGCYIVPSFGGMGKITCWNTWSAVDEVTAAFSALTTAPDSKDYWLETLDHFVVLLYAISDHTSSLQQPNEA